MTRLLEFLIALGLVLALFLIVGLVLPSKRHLEESVETNRRMTIVYDTVNNVRRLKDWNRMLPGNPAELTYSGGGATNAGVGARVDFASDSNPQWKKGSWEIVESTPPPEFGGPAKVTYAIVDGRSGSDKKTSFALTPSGKNNRNVRITQSYDVKYGFNLLGRYMGMYLGSHVGDSMKAGLGRLTTLLSTIPNADYRAPGDKLTPPTIVDLPAEDVLFVNAGNIERSVGAISTSIKANQEWIRRVMASNGLEAAGPVRIVTTDFGATRYAFDVAQPVRKTGATGPLTVSTAGTPVKYERLEPRKAVFASYTGNMVDLDGKRNAMRAWAMTNGYEVTDRPYDAWKGGVDKAFGDEGEFDIYWAIKQ